MEICEMKISFLFFHNCGKIKMMSLGKFAANISHHLFHLIFFLDDFLSQNPSAALKSFTGRSAKWIRKFLGYISFCWLRATFSFPHFFIAWFVGNKQDFSGVSSHHIENLGIIGWNLWKMGMLLCPAASMLWF